MGVATCVDPNPSPQRYRLLVGVPGTIMASSVTMRPLSSSFALLGPLRGKLGGGVCQEKVRKSNSGGARGAGGSIRGQRVLEGDLRSSRVRGLRDPRTAKFFWFIRLKRMVT